MLPVLTSIVIMHWIIYVHEETTSPLNINALNFLLCHHLDCSLSLGLQSGILIAVPIPSSHAADGELIEGAIQQALIEAE